MDLIEMRRSVREFDVKKEVTREQLTELVKAAMLAPSACNSRPWEFIVITNRGILDKITEIHPNARMLATAKAAIVIVATPQSGRPEGYFPQDCGAATQNILLKACEIGLGTCWCGVYPKPDRTESLRSLLNIKEPKIPFNVIAVGFPAESPVQRGFYDKEKVLFIE